MKFAITILFCILVSANTFYTKELRSLKHRVHISCSHPCASFLLKIANMKYTDKEIWKAVVGFEGFYEISTHGRLRGLDRTNIRANGRPMPVKARYLNPSPDKAGYFRSKLCNVVSGRVKRVHLLIAEAFWLHKPNRKMVVDHIDNDKSNNHISNLQIITSRQNSVKDLKLGRSKHVGVHFNKISGKYNSRIIIDGKRLFLGSFEKEEEAGKAYQDRLAEHIKNGGQ